MGKGGKDNQERFAAIPERALRDHRLSGIHFRALGIIALHDRGSDDGCWAKQETMATEVDCARSYLAQAIKDLVVWAYLHCGKHAKDARRKVYRVIYGVKDMSERPDTSEEICRNVPTDICRNFSPEPVEFQPNHSGTDPLTDPLIKGTDGAALDASNKEEGQSGKRWVWVEGVKILERFPLPSLLQEGWLGGGSRIAAGIKRGSWPRLRRRRRWAPAIQSPTSQPP